jgi:hypothetical protein
MRNLSAKWLIPAAACVAAASLAACHDDSNNGSGAAPPPASTSFTTFATNTFAANANSVPVNLDAVTFTFDADDSPTAFDTLVMSGVY